MTGTAMKMETIVTRLYCKDQRGLKFNFESHDIQLSSQEFGETKRILEEKF